MYPYGPLWQREKDPPNPSLFQSPLQLACLMTTFGGPTPYDIQETMELRGANFPFSLHLLPRPTQGLAETPGDTPGAMKQPDLNHILPVGCFMGVGKKRLSLPALGLYWVPRTMFRVGSAPLKDIRAHQGPWQLPWKGLEGQRWGGMKG